MDHTGRLTRRMCLILAGAAFTGCSLLVLLEAVLRQMGVTKDAILPAWATTIGVTAVLSLLCGWLWGRRLERQAQEIAQMADLLLQGEAQPIRCQQDEDAIGDAALHLQEAMDTLNQRMNTIGRALDAATPTLSAADAPNTLRGMARLEDTTERVTRSWAQESQRVGVLSGSLAEGLSRMSAELRKQTMSAQFRAAALARLGSLTRTFAEQTQQQTHQTDQANQIAQSAQQGMGKREAVFFEVSEQAAVCAQQARQVRDGWADWERLWKELDAVGLQARAEAARSGNQAVATLGEQLGRIAEQVKRQSQAEAASLTTLSESCEATASKLQAIPAPGFAAREAAQSSRLADQTVATCCRMAARVAEQADQSASDCLGTVNLMRELTDLAQSLLVQATLLRRGGNMAMPVVAQPPVMRIPGTSVTYTVLEGEDSTAGQ